MVNTGVLYAITAGVAGITISVILNRITSTEHKELIDKKLVDLLHFFSIFCVIDMIWGLLSAKLFGPNQLLYTIFTYAFHLGAALSAFLWAGYVINYIRVQEKYQIVLNVCRDIVLSIQLMVLVSNIWNNNFFYVDADANYHSYSMRNFMFAMQFFYYFALIFFTLFKISFEKSKENKERNRRYGSALVFSCVPLAFGFGQMLWPDASMYSLGFMLTAVLLYSINISSEREEYLKKLYQNENIKLQEVVFGLSDDYQVIYLVDLNTNEYEVFGESPDYKRDISSRLNRAKDFFVDFSLNIKNVVAEEDREEVANMLRKEHIFSELATQKSFSFNYRISINGQEKYYLCKVIGVANNWDNENKIIIGVFDDDGRVRREASQRKALEDALLAAENANQAKTSFLFNMSHDIRTPMNSIIGFTNLAIKHIDDKKYLSECLSKVSLSGEHLLSLINDVLDMSRIESGKLIIDDNPESILERNNQVLSIVQELAVARSINFISKNVNVDKEWVICDALHLKQILLNILSNAIKYTNPGGKVDYVMEQSLLWEGRVRMEFTVVDNGIGMSEEFLDKIYDEFERENNSASDKIQGTGLGMSIVKRLVDMMGGTIDITSTQGVGTTVKLKLEFDVAKPVVEELVEPEVSKLPKGKHILLVDDNALNREIAIDILSELEVSCEVACDGLEAAEMVKEKEAGHFDLILMDVQMPRMNGYDATKTIRGLDNPKKANIPIIAMTANAFEEDRRDAFNAGMNEHLSKPIDIATLSKTLSVFLKA